jgi:hypothetical protein
MKLSVFLWLALLAVCFRASAQANIAAIATERTDMTYRKTADIMINYTYSQPLGKMNSAISHINGLNGQMLFNLANSRYSVGGELGYHNYRAKTERQNHTFNGVPTVIDAQVLTSLVTINALGRADLVRSGDVIPYLMGQTGINVFRTNLGLHNPDPRGCQALDIRPMISNAAFSFAGGAGARFYLGEVSHGRDYGRIWLDLSVQYVHGGRVTFLTTDIRPNGPHLHRSVNNAPSVYQAKFINPDSREVHTHPVGTLHTAPVRLMQYKVGFGYRLPYL